jgi:hypothetical protein
MKKIHLFLIFLALFIADLFIPDPLPLIDELVLVAFAGWYGVKSVKWR